ncbi:MAG: hypothetical protein AVDCRST_MAG85-2770, partial [uncultured Solirubrobacteraceae bacterium]
EGVRARHRRDEPAPPRPRGRPQGRPRRRRGAADVRRRLLRARDGAGDLRSRGGDQLRADGPRRAGVPLGAARGGGRRDRDDGQRQGDRRARRQGLLRLRVGVAQPARRERLRGHVDQHRAGDL